MSEEDEEDQLNTMGEFEKSGIFHGNIRFKAKMAERKRLMEYTVTRQNLKEDLGPGWVLEENEFGPDLTEAERKMLSHSQSQAKMRLFYFSLLKFKTTQTSHDFSVNFLKVLFL